MKKLILAEAWLQFEIDGPKIYGEAITEHHRKWMTSSYHCVLCGAPLNPLKEMYPCWNCKGTLNEN